MCSFSFSPFFFHLVTSKLPEFPKTETSPPLLKPTGSLGNGDFFSCFPLVLFVTLYNRILFAKISIASPQCSTFLLFPLQLQASFQKTLKLKHLPQFKSPQNHWVMVIFLVLSLLHYIKRTASVLSIFSPDFHWFMSVVFFLFSPFLLTATSKLPEFLVTKTSLPLQKPTESLGNSNFSCFQFICLFYTLYKENCWCFLTNPSPPHTHFC